MPESVAPQRILVVNPFGIGDVLFTTPLIGALKQRYPAASISYIGNARTVPFLKNDSRLERVFCYERDDFVAIYRKSPIRFLRRWFDFAQEIRAGGFDTAFDLSLGSPLALALVWAGIPRRIGYDHKGRGRWLTDKVPLKGYEARHVAAYYLDLLGGTRPAGRMEIFSSDADKTRAAAFRRTHQLTERGFTVIHPGGGASWGNSAGLKRWPAVNFAGLADKMIEKGGLPIILMGDKNEVALCAEVAGLMKHRPILAAGALSLTEAAAVMGAAKLVVANDGGPLHVAVAAGAVTASIFGPVDPVVYGPYPPDTHLVVQKGLACQPCYRRFRMSDCRHQACLKSLSVDEVFNKISRLI